MVLRHRDFAKLWIGQLISKLGSQFNYIALAWVVLQQTGSGALTGGVYISQVLPNALFGWVAGVAVDRGDKRKIMIGCDLARGVLAGLLPLAWLSLGYHSLALVYSVTFGISFFSLLFFSAEKSLLPHLIPEDELTEANAYAEMTEQMGGLLGPVVGGILVAALSSPLQILYIDALTFFLSALFLMALTWCREGVPEPVEGGWRAVLAEARDGMSHLMRNRFLKVVFITAACANFLIAPFTVIFPVLSKEVLGAGAQGFGWLMGGIGGGMLLGSLAAAPLAKRLSAPLLIYGGMALIGVAFASMGFAHSLALCVGLAALAGFCLSPSNALFLTLVQQGTPAELQGRVFASLFALMSLTIPLGVSVVAPLLDYLGPPEVLVGVGALLLLAALVGRLVLGDALPAEAP